MRFLADESCDFAIVRALREARNDVLAVAEAAPRAPDSHVLELAVRDRRVLLTEDKDFGQLVYATGRRAAGVVFIRYPANARQSLPGAVLAAVEQLGERLLGSFVVLKPGIMRIDDSFEWESDENA